MAILKPLSNLNSMKTKKKIKKIDWVCNDCGVKYGRWYQPGARAPEISYSTYHLDICDVCGTSDVPVTEPRDFGYLVEIE
jgi:hypothetical protein